jgi:hypothetical protein
MHVLGVVGPEAAADGTPLGDGVGHTERY